MFYVYLGIINLITFAVFGLDKRKAQRHRYRIPERTLLFLSVIGGCYGALLGMYRFHHKTRHRKFTVLVPVCCMLWLVIVLQYAYDFLGILR